MNSLLVINVTAFSGKCKHRKNNFTFFFEILPDPCRILLLRRGELPLHIARNNPSAGCRKTPFRRKRRNALFTTASEGIY